MTASGNRGGSLRRTVRSFALRCRNSRLLVRTLSRIPTGGGVILRYHSVNSDRGWTGDYVQESLVVSPETFDRQVAFLARRHRIVGVAEIAEAVSEGRLVDHRSVAITFDDGYEDNYRFALPVLLRHGATAAFYVTTGAIGDREVLWPVKVRHAVRRSDRAALELSFVDRGPVDLSTADAREAAVRFLTGIVKRLPAGEADEALGEIIEACGAPPGVRDRRIIMNEGEIREVRDAGMTVGAHTVNHYNLPSLESSDVETEIGASKGDLETSLGADVLHFAYPDGRTGRHCDGRVARIVAEQGFRSAVTSIAGPASRRGSPYGIPRLGVYSRHASIPRFAADIQHTRFERPSDRALEEIRSSVPARPADGGGTGPA